MKVISAKTKKNREKIENRFIYIMLFIQMIVGSEECPKTRKIKGRKKIINLKNEQRKYIVTLKEFGKKTRLNSRKQKKNGWIKKIKKKSGI